MFFLLLGMMENGIGVLARKKIGKKSVQFISLLLGMTVSSHSNNFLKTISCFFFLGMTENGSSLLRI